MKLFRITPTRAAAASVAFIAVWQTSVWCATKYEWSAVAAGVKMAGWICTYALGLGWLIWGAERAAQRIEANHVAATRGAPSPALVLRREGCWNPLDLNAWYYGRESPRLFQSLALLGAYSMIFMLFYFWLMMQPTRASASVEPFDLPSGGGGDSLPKRTVRVVKKVVNRKKYVINPYSSIVFNVPPIDNIDPKIVELSQNLYQVGQGGDGPSGSGLGQGSGKGSGFGQGTGKGKIRLPRLRHSDKQWDRNFGIGADTNMLVEFHQRTRMNVADKTEIIDVGQLAGLGARASPPLLYVAGTSSFQLAPKDQRALKQYLIEKRGMVLGDNLGGSAFHASFIATMREVTGVHEVPIPRDDFIHRRPYALPSLPIVVAHGGTVPLGWNVDGRWVAYYHPGALSDAWRDDHAGIKRDVWEECYQLGVNLIFYAYREKHLWLESQNKP